MELEAKVQASKDTCTGLMRHLISIWYPSERLAVCSASKGINERIRTAVFSKIKKIPVKYLYFIVFVTEYCLEKFPSSSADKLMRDLTNKCGEERRSLLKAGLTHN